TSWPDQAPPAPEGGQSTGRRSIMEYPAMSERRDAEQETITLEWRGRDIALVPPAALWALEESALLAALFGPEAATAVGGILTRDRRAHMLRARPIDFARIKEALLAAASYRVRVAFAERPALPWEPHVTMAPRPYQVDALTLWRAEGCHGTVVLPTGSGKTLVGALAIAEVALETLVVVPTIDLLGQWQRALAQVLERELDDVGVYGGGAHGVRPITVVT